MTDENDFDFSVFEEATDNKQDEATLENLMREAEAMAELKENIESLDETLKQLNKQYTYIAQEVIPNMLDELGMKTFELKDGSKVTVKEFISGSLPKEPELFHQAVNWLIENDLESILKTDVTLKFGKGEEEIAKKVVDNLKKEGYDPDSKYGVHPQTLYSSIRELSREGVDVPYELLGLYAGKKADIKLSKGK